MSCLRISGHPLQHLRIIIPLLQSTHSCGFSGIYLCQVTTRKWLDLLCLFSTSGDSSMGLACVPYLPKVLPNLFHIVRICEDGLKEFLTWKLGTLVSIARQHIRKYLPELLSLISELWSSFSLPVANRPVHIAPILHLVEQLCLALNDEFRKYLPDILPCCIEFILMRERFNDYTYVIPILHTLEVFGGTLDEVRRGAIKTLTRLIPCVQVTGHISSLVRHLKFVLDGETKKSSGKMLLMHFVA